MVHSRTIARDLGMARDAAAARPRRVAARASSASSVGAVVEQRRAETRSRARGLRSACRGRRRPRAGAPAPSAAASTVTMPTRGRRQRRLSSATAAGSTSTPAPASAACSSRWNSDEEAAAGRDRGDAFATSARAASMNGASSAGRRSRTTRRGEAPRDDRVAHRKGEASPDCRCRRAGAGSASRASACRASGQRSPSTRQRCSRRRHAADLRDVAARAAWSYRPDIVRIRRAQLADVGVALGIEVVDQAGLAHRAVLLRPPPRRPRVGL